MWLHLGLFYHVNMRFLNKKKKKNLQNFNYYFYDTFENFLNNNIEVHVLIANWKVFLMTYLKISF